MKARSKSTALIAAALAAILLPAAGCHKKTAAEAPPPPPEQTASTPTPTANLTATPDNVAPGQSVVLNWSTTYATDVSIDGIGAVNANGTQTVNPTATTTYHLVARGEGGSTEATATVTVNAPEAAASSTMTEAMFDQNVKPVFYDYDSYDVNATGQQAIAQDAAFLQAHPDAKILVAGYCDERGSEEYNLALGQNRANAAKNALVQAGVSASRLRTISYGKEKQFCTEHNEACWQQNRRAQFSLDQ
ncbi:MAG TPA: peptidoglycan-associated lipoprotein Pal [Acidobacteriaceae bacterium]|nr:peptidoglycan-associated lipoprotein Pal [Acidobacteriaceae bacterium]